MEQQWINSEGNFLSIQTMGVKKGNPIICFAGFAEPKSDLSYWLSNLGKSLSVMGYFILLVDLTGCGNSYGELSDVSLGSIERDMINVIKYVNVLTNRKAVVIARGLSAALSIKVYDANLINWCIAINPFHIENIELSSMQFEIEDIYIRDDSEDEILKSILRFMGTEITNIESRVIKKHFLCSVISLDWTFIYENAKINYTIIQFDDSLDVRKVPKNDYVLYEKKWLYYREKSFPDNSEGIDKLLSEIKKELSIIEKKG